MAGFIKLSRDFLSWEWYDDPNTFRVFIHLLLNANYEDKKYHGIDIKRGQVVVGLCSLAEALGLSVRNVRTAIEHLKSTNEVTIKTTNKFSVVTICNIERWQGQLPTTDKQNDKQPTSDRQTTDKQLTKPEEIKKEIKKEIEKEYNILLSSAKDELLRVKEEMQAVIDDLKAELEEGKKERKPRAKPIPRTLGGFAREAFEVFYKKQTGIEYDWSKKDASHMKMLLQRIRRSRENRETPLPCDDESMIEALNGFFSYVKDPWLLEHLDVANVNSKYNEIVAAAKGKKAAVPNMEVGRIITEHDKDKFKNTKKYFK